MSRGGSGQGEISSVSAVVRTSLEKLLHLLCMELVVQASTLPPPLSVQAKKQAGCLHHNAPPGFPSEQAGRD